MFDILSLSLALSIGQGPGYQPVIVAPPVQQRVIPNTLPVVPQPRYAPTYLTADDQPMPRSPSPTPTEEPKKDGNGNGEEKKDEEEKKEPDKYFFMKLFEKTPVGASLAERGWSISGWTQMSYTASTTSRTNLPVTFNDAANEYQMNQNFLRIDKAIDPEKKELQFGLRTEVILPGTDARFTVPRGLFDNQLRNGNNGGPRPYPIDIYQIYGELFLPNIAQGTTVRVGRFATHCEYEITQGAETPFLTRSYTFQYNPFTHTGIWVITPLDDTWTISNGAVLGSDNFIDPASRLTYVGQLKWAPKEGKTQVLFNTVITQPRFNVAENFAFYNTYNLQIIHKVTEKLTYILDTTYSHGYDFPGVGRANWFGAVNWLQYQVTEKLASNLRFEIFDDSQGVRTGFEGTYFATTYGVTWSPENWLLIRPFARADYNEKNRPFEGDKDLYTAGLDLIVRW